MAGVNGNARIRCPSPTPSAFQLPINSHRAAMVALQQRAAAAAKTTTSSPPTNLTISPSLPAHTIDMQITPKPAIIGSKIGVTSTTPDNQKPFTVTEVTNSLQSCTVEQNSVVDPKSKCTAEQPETQSQRASDEIDNVQNDEKSSCNLPAPDVSPATKKNATKEKRTKKQTPKHPKVALRKRVMNAQFLAKINHTAAAENTTGNETSSTPQSPDAQADENQAKTENVKTIGNPGNEVQSSSNLSPELKKEAPNHRIVHPRFRFLHSSSPTPPPPPQSNNNATVLSPSNNNEYDNLVQTHNSTVQNETKLESGDSDCKKSSFEKVLQDEKRGAGGESKKKKLKRRWSECNEKNSKDSNNKEKGRQKKNTDTTGKVEEEKKSVNYTVKDLPKVLAFIEDNATRKTTEKDDLTKKKHELTEELKKRLNLLQVLNVRMSQAIDSKSNREGKVDTKFYDDKVQGLHEKLKNFEKYCKEKHQRMVQVEQKRLNQEMWMTVKTCKVCKEVGMLKTCKGCNELVYCSKRCKRQHGETFHHITTKTTTTTTT